MAAKRVFDALNGRRVLNRTLRTTVRGMEDKEIKRGFSLRKRLLRSKTKDSNDVESVKGSLCGRNTVKTIQLSLEQLTKLRKIGGGRIKRQLMHQALYRNIKKATRIKVKMQNMKGKDKIGA